MNNKEIAMGTRCRICTGCGLCVGQKKGLTVLKGRAFLRDYKADGIWFACIDIGTTTLAMELYDEEGKAVDYYTLVNPQIRFGADVISRILAGEKEEQLYEMSGLIRRELLKGLNQFKSQLPKGFRLEIWAAGNTVMSYILLGLNPGELGRAPFTMSHCRSGNLLRLGTEEVHLLPCLSAFVGGDLTAGVMALDYLIPEEKRIKGNVLLLDLGTNGEMLLSMSEEIVSTSVAAGTAFEGGAEAGVFGADLLHCLAALREENILDEEGLLAEEYFESGVMVGNVLITQEMVRKLQLAKAAVASGIEILMSKKKFLASDLDGVVLAGGFGFYLQPADAVAIGLLPKSFLDKTVSGGNACLQGLLVRGAMGVSVESFLNKKRENISLPDWDSFDKIYVKHLKLTCFDL